MKNITPRAFLLGAALLSTGALFATAPSAQAQTRRDVRDARRELRDAKRDLRREQAQYRNRNVRPGYRRPGYRPVAPAPPRRRGTYRYTGRTYNGRVTNVRSAQSFDINIGGNIYNVYTVSRLPLGLSRGDLVRVTGDQMYSNDIRNARAYLIRNGR